MKKGFTLATFFFLYFTIYAQLAFERTYRHTVGDIGNCAIQTSDGGYAIVGYSYNNVGYTDICLIKTNALGDTLWTRMYGGIRLDEGRYLRQTTDGGYYIAGITTSFLEDGEDFFLIRTDSNGDTLWTRRYGSFAINDDQSLFGFCITRDGGCVMVGQGGSLNVLGNFTLCGYAVRSDSSGNMLWTKPFSDSFAGTILRAVQQTIDGGFVISGTITGPLTISNDPFLLKIDSSGVVKWGKSYLGMANETCNDLFATRDGGYILTGQSQGASFTTYVIKTDSTGDTLWTRIYIAPSACGGFSIRQTNDDKFILLGNTDITGTDTTKIFLIKIDMNGDTIWTRKYGGSWGNLGWSVEQTTDNGFIIGGQSNSFNTSNGATPDFYLIKTDSIGHGPCHELSTNFQVARASLSAISNTFLTVDTGFTDSPPTVVSQNGVSTLLLCGTTTVNEFTINPIRIYPNPSNGKFALEFPNSRNDRVVEIYSLLGEKIYGQKSESEKYTEVFLDLAKGLYILKVSEDLRLDSYKIIIE
jgi:hypothetical protein